MNGNYSISGPCSIGRVNGVVRKACLVPIGILALSWSARAASFDCAGATNWRDRMICETPELSALDEQLAQLYQMKRAMLSPHGAELLQSSKRSWLQYVDTVCRDIPPPVSGIVGGSATCLEQRYQERLTELAQVAQKVGPYIFNRIDMFAAEPHEASDETGSVSGFYIHHLAFPQIDDESSAAVATWNKVYEKSAIDQGPVCDGDMGDTDQEYQIGYANQHVTSVGWSKFVYCHGTPHGFGTVSTDNLVLDQSSRQSNPRDVFAEGWEAPLKRLVWSALLTKGWTPPDDLNQADSARREIEAIAITPSRWLFTSDGLSVSFSSYEGGCYACTPRTTTVVWDDLRPLLVPGSLIP